MLAESGRGNASGADAKARGAEFSALEVFNGQMYTFCDRTGKIFNIKADIKDTPDGWLPSTTECAAELIPEGGDGTAGEEIVIRGGDGSAGKKALKCEWCAADVIFLLQTLLGLVNELLTSSVCFGTGPP